MTLGQQKKALQYQSLEGLLDVYEARTYFSFLIRMSLNSVHIGAPA